MCFLFQAFCFPSTLVWLCRESTSSVKLFKNFKEASAIKTNFAAEAISGGSLLAVRSTDFVCFYDWGSGKVHYLTQTSSLLAPALFL